MKQDWYQSAVGYEIYPRSFCDSNGDGIGDIKGIISKLAYLKDLGIDFIWITPMYASPNVDNGYDISDYYAINPEYGTLEDVKDLIQQAHEMGIKVLFDLVVNHTSDQHPWFRDAKSSKTSPYRDFYHWKKGKDNRPPNDWIGFSGLSTWTYDALTDEYYFHLFDQKQPDLNWKNPKLRQAIYDMIRFWLELGIDGFRIDAISHIQKADWDVTLQDSKGDGAYQPFMNVSGIEAYLSDMKAIYEEYDALTVGEASGVSSQEAPKWTGRNGYMTMLFEWEHNYRFETGKGDVVKFIEILDRWQVDMQEQGWLGLYLENHDLPRIIDTFGDGSDSSAKAFAVAYFCLRGTPFIYQGQEIGMTNGDFKTLEEFNEPKMKRRYESYRQLLADKEAFERAKAWSKDNARTPMQWDASCYAGFSTVKPWLRVNSQYREKNIALAQKDEQSVFYLYKNLINLRHHSQAIAVGNYQRILVGHEAVFVYQRQSQTESCLILVNLTAEKVSISMPKVIRDKNWRLVLSSEKEGLELKKSLSLPAYFYAVYQI